MPPIEMIPDPHPTPDAAPTFKTLGLTFAGLIVATLLALWASQWHGLLAALGIGVLITLTGGTVGAVLGFLFALPRVLSKDSKDDEQLATKSSDSAKQRFLGSNTNLERVSDWLTTMIVGVGLTQLGNVDSSLYRFRSFLSETARVFPDSKGGNAGTLPGIGPLLLILGLAGGFVGLYLFTRLKLSALFQRVEEDLNGIPTYQAAEVKHLAAKASAQPGAAESPAIQAVLSSTQPSVDESLNLMYTFIYRNEGYQQVIDIGGQLSITAATKRAEYWFYLAAAFGQKYSALRAADQSPIELQSSKDNAFDCARRAVALDPAYKSLLWNISDPDGVDDDLAAFRDDATFRSIVGVPLGRRGG